MQFCFLLASLHSAIRLGCFAFFAGRVYLAAMLQLFGIDQLIFKCSIIDYTFALYLPIFFFKYLSVFVAFLHLFSDCIFEVSCHVFPPVQCCISGLPFIRLVPCSV